MVAKAVSVPKEQVAALVKVPEAERGDFSLPCFPFAKSLRKNPAAIAKDLADALESSELFEKIEAVGPYLNAFVNKKHVVARIVPAVRTAGENYLNSDEGEKRRVCVDFSSPNIAKPLGFHHLRSTMIGNALVRIHDALGFETVRFNFLGDWGKTFGLLAEAFVRFGDRARLKVEGISYLLELYIKANEAVKTVEGFDDAARAMFVRQEQGDAEAMELWKLFRDISLAEFEKIYRRLDVSFDYYEGESHYRDGMEGIIARIERQAGTREDQGALIVDMEYEENEPPLMLRKSDGATLYATRDIAAAIDRYERFEFAKSLYVVGVEQKRHFDQLKRALRAMGEPWHERVHHVSFGRVLGMSTRKGTVVFLEDVLDEAVARALAKMQETGDDKDFDLDTVAEQVGIGGVVFGDLKNLRTSDYTFDWEEILNTKGFTGICCQYAHARCCSVLRKAGGAPGVDEVDHTLLAAPEEAALVKELARLPQAVQAAAEKLEPSLLARAVYEVARSWNRYQQAGNNDRGLRVLCEEPGLRAARLALVDGVRIALGRGLYLLGVAAPEAM